MTSKEDSSLTILLLNACSLLNKFDEVLTLPVSHKPHIIAITESWLHDKISDPEIEIRDYSLLRKDRKGRGGGAILFIRSSLRPKLVWYMSRLLLLGEWRDMDISPR